MGSPAFAIPALLALRQAGHAIVAVYCQPPRPAGRGQAMTRCPVHATAEALGVDVRTPQRLRADPAAQSAFADLNLDVAIVAAYGLILPQSMLDAPVLGCLNIHASLLPKWRGAAPIQAAIKAGDSEAGITIMQMEAGLDSGPMLLRQSVPIGATTTTAILHDQLAEIGASLILEALANRPSAQPQPTDHVSYAPKLTRADGRIDWTQAAETIDRQVRAFDPWPSTFTLLEGRPLKVLAVEKTQGIGSPGTVIDNRLTVACGSGAIWLTRLQIAGGRALDAASFLRGHPIPPGTVLGV